MVKLFYSYGKGKFWRKAQDSRQGIVCLPCPNPEFVKVIFTKEKSRFLNLSKEEVEEHLRTLPVTAYHQFHPHNVNLSQSFHTEWDVTVFEKGKIGICTRSLWWQEWRRILCLQECSRCSETPLEKPEGCLRKTSYTQCLVKSRGTATTKRKKWVHRQTVPSNKPSKCWRQDVLQHVGTKICNVFWTKPLH